MLADGIRYDFTVLCYGIHFHLLGMFYELAYHYRMLLGYVCRQLQEAFQFFLIGTDVHSRTGKHITGTNQHRKSYLPDKIIDVLQRGKRTPFGLVHTDTVQHSRELIAILGIVNALGTRSKDRHILRVKAQGKVIWNLAACRHDYAMRIFQFENVHDTLEGEFVEIETVAHVIIRRYGLGVVVNHDAAITFLADGVQRLHTAPVELYRGADAVCPRTEYNDRFAVAQIMHIIGNAAVCQIQIIGSGGILGGECIYLFHYGQHPHALAQRTYGKYAVLAIHIAFQTKSAGYLQIGEALYLGSAQQFLRCLVIPNEADDLFPLNFQRNGFFAAFRTTDGF